MKLKARLALATLLTIGLSSAAAFADSVTFTLIKPNGYLPVTGGSMVYDATVSAPLSNSGAVFLNGDAYNVTAPLTVNDTDFFTNFPLSLAPGASFTGDLFVVTAPPGTPFGTFLGTFTLLGGANGNAVGTLGTVNFSVSAVPEPSSVVLLLTSMAALLWIGFKGDLRRGWAR